MTPNRGKEKRAQDSPWLGWASIHHSAANDAAALVIFGQPFGAQVVPGGARTVGFEHSLPDAPLRVDGFPAKRRGH